MTMQVVKDQPGSYYEFDLMPFYLLRHEDETKKSGTGVVAQGIATTFDAEFAMVWQTVTPSFVIHDSMSKATLVHGHGGKSEFITISESNLIFAADRDLFGIPFRMIHTDIPPHGLTKIGTVGKGIVVNNGYVIYRWCCYPFSWELFTSMDHFRMVHIDGNDWSKLENV